MGNWIGSPNPFHVAAPPQWWLQELLVFDDQLVVFPSQQVPYAYRLARRATRTAGFRSKTLREADPRPDTKMYAKHRLLPILTILPTSGWDHQVFQYLADRDIWRHGGAKRFTDTLEASEAAQVASLDRRHDDDLDERVRRSLEHLKRRTGQRISTTGLPVARPPKGLSRDASPALVIPARN
jgi:hypothetical protein